MKIRQLSGALLMLALTACSGGDQPSPDPREDVRAAETPAAGLDSPGTVEAAPEASDGARPPGAAPEQDPPKRPPRLPGWTAGVLERKGGQGVAVLTAVRTARQEEYDRIVFEFGAGPLPGYHVSYIDRPVRACGSGDVVPLPGDGWLEMRFVPAQAHTDEGRPTVTARSRKLALPNLKQVTMTCDFEADVTWVAGVLSPNDFRVLELKDPNRLVVDIRHR